MCTWKSSGGEFWQHRAFPQMRSRLRVCVALRLMGLEEEVQDSYTPQDKYSELEGYSLVWQDSVRCKKIKAPT